MASIVAKLLKKNIGRIADFDLSTMLMKTSQLYCSFHDVDDKKGTYKKTRFAIHLPRMVYSVAKYTPVGTVRAEKSPPGSRDVFEASNDRRAGKIPSQASLTEPGEMAYCLHDFDRDRHYPGDTLRRFQQSLA